MAPDSGSLSGQQLGRIESSTLRAAAEFVLDRWSEEGDPSDREDLSQAIGEIVQRVEAARDASFSSPGQAPADPALSRRLLDALQEALLSLREDSVLSDDGQVLDDLQAIWSVRRALWPTGEESMATRLAEPDAFELIVEVAHDLRSPLASIVFLSETLRSGRSGEVNDLQRSQLGLIYSAALGIASVANDVMELGKGMVSLGLDQEPGPFYLREVLENLSEMLRPMAEEKGIDLQISYPGGGAVMGHQLPLSRVLLNLTSNALKFTNEGYVQVEAVRVDDGTFEFSVEDSGRGMSPEQQEALYKPFRKAARREGHFFSGSGLGLSIARRLVEGMGSDLRFETEPGEGTRFHFQLELERAPSHLES